MKEIFGMNLTQILKEAVKESVGDVFSTEREKQTKTAEQMKPFKVSEKSKLDPEKNADSEVDEGEDDTEPEKSRNDEPVKVKKSDIPEINLTTIVDLIGAIRAGQSLKDKKVLSSLKDYFDRLNGNERIALYAFLTGISKLMVNIDTPESDGNNVDTPTSDPFKIRMKKETPKEDPRPAKGEEAPIVVGEVANKNKERRVVISNRRYKK